MRPSPPPAQWLNGSPPPRPAGCMRPRPRPARCARRCRRRNACAHGPGRRDAPVVAAGGITEQARPDETSVSEAFSRSQLLLDSPKKVCQNRYLTHSRKNSATLSRKHLSAINRPLNRPLKPTAHRLRYGGLRTRSFEFSVSIDGVTSSQSPAGAIDRMIGIERPPIKTNVGSEPAELDEPLRGVVTFLAKRLERAKPEFIDVAVMWLDVIADCRLA